MNVNLLKKIMNVGIAALVLSLGLAVGFAHNGFEHVMGTVTAITPASITVQTVKQGAVTVILDGSTQYMSGTTAVSMKSIEVGKRVVIDAKPNADKKLVGSIVKLAAAGAAGTEAHADHDEHSDHDHK